MTAKKRGRGISTQHNKRGEKVTKSLGLGHLKAREKCGDKGNEDDAHVQGESPGDRVSMRAEEEALGLQLPR